MGNTLKLPNIKEEYSYQWALKEIANHNITPQNRAYPNLDDLIYYTNKHIVLFESPGKNGALIRVQFFPSMQIVYYEIDYYNREHLKLENPEMYAFLKRSGDYLVKQSQISGFGKKHPTYSNTIPFRTIK